MGEYGWTPVEFSFCVDWSSFFVVVRAPIAFSLSLSPLLIPLSRTLVLSLSHLPSITHHHLAMDERPPVAAPPSVPKAPPRRGEREQCWAARDAFLACLKAHNESKTRCAREHKAMFDQCPETWAAHYVQSHVAELRQKQEQEKLLQDYQRERRAAQSGQA